MKCLVVVLAGSLGGCIVTTSATERPAYVEYVYVCREPRGVVTKRPPPTAPPEDAQEEEANRGKAPPRSNWVPGHYDWRGRPDGFTWMPGRWERVRPGVTWVPPVVEKKPDGRHRFTPGHWRPVEPGRQGGQVGAGPGKVGGAHAAPTERGGGAPGPARARRRRPDVNAGDVGGADLPGGRQVPARLVCSEVSPARHLPGGVVRLRGRGFGTSVSAVDVRLSGTPAADVRRVTDDEIVAKVPAEGRSGRWTVAVEGLGQVTCEGEFEVGR